MARIVCQALLQSEHVTFIWSQEQAFFEPYHLRGAAVQQFCSAARQAREHLAAVVQAGQSAEALARAGFEIYRLIFQSDAAGVGRKVEEWLRDLEEKNEIESLEIVSDVPGRIPWNLVCSEEPKGPPNRQAFWGVRFPLACGRRVNPLRLNPMVSEPDLLLVLDASGDSAQQVEWRKLGLEHSWRTATTRAELMAALEQRCPDLLCWTGKVRDGSLFVGTESVALSDLRAGIDAASEGSLEPIVLLEPAAENARGEGDFLERAALQFPGLIGWQTPVAAAQAGPIARRLVAEVLAGKQLSHGLRDLGRSEGWPALALTAFCPPHIALGGAAGEEPRSLYELPDEPYAALRPLDREDRPLLGGRDRDIFRFSNLLDEPAGSLLILHGAFGAGKASFMRAGVIPFLEDDSHGYLALRNRGAEGEPAATEMDYPVLAIRATRDLAGQLAEALCVFCEQDFRYRTPMETTVSVPLQELLGAACGLASEGAKPQAASPLALWKALENDANLLGKLLQTLSERLPRDLLILIEQGEELITLAKPPEDERRRRRALDMLLRAAKQAPRCKLVLSVRSDFLGRLRAELPAAATVREYLLPELSREALLEILLLPTADGPIPFTAEVPEQKYHIKFTDDFPGKLAKQLLAEAAKSRQSAVALLQVVGARLFARARASKVAALGPADLKLIGGVAGIIRKDVDKRLQTMNLSKRTKQGLRELLGDFCVGQPDGTVVRDLFTMQKTLDGWKRRDREEATRAVAAAEKAGLLESQHLLIDGQEGACVSLPSDSLARVVQDWSEEKIYDWSAWKRGMVDTLWITIPLICVAATLAYFFTNRYHVANEVTRTENFEKNIKELSTSALAQIQTLAFPQYVASLHQAEDAWRTGNMWTMRRALLTQQAKPQRLEGRERNDKDLRGFAWYYLWGLANSEMHYLPGHEAPVAAVAVSPDGSLVASGCREGKLFLWNHATGIKRATLRGHVGAVHAVVFSGDGKWLISAGDDKTIRLWSTAAGKDGHVFVDKADRTLQGHTKTVLALAANHTVLVSAGADETVMVWELDKSQPKYVLKAHSAAVNALALAQGGKFFASGDAAGKVNLWDIDSGKKQNSLDASTGPVRALTFANDGKWLLTGGSDTKNALLGPDQYVGVIRAWDAATAKPHPTPDIVHGTEVFALALDTQGKILASAGKDHFVRLWDADTFKEIGLIKGHLGWVRSLAFAPDGKSLVSGSYDSDVKIWQPRSTPESDVLRPGDGPLTSVSISADDKYLAAAGKDGNVYLWSLAAKKLLHTITGLKGSVTSLSFSTASRDKGVLAAATRIGSDQGHVHVWRLKENKGVVAIEEYLSLPSADRTVECLAFSSDGKKLAWGGVLGKKTKEPDKALAPANKHVIEIWDMDADRKKGAAIKLSGDVQAIRCLAFNPSDELIAAGSSDNGVRVWHLESGRQVPGSPYPGHGGPVLGVSFVQIYLLSASADGSIRIWSHDETATFRSLGVYRGHVGPVNAVVAGRLFPLAKQQISAGADRTVRIWQIGQGDRFALRGPTAPIRGLAVSTDGKTIAAAGDDGTVHLWRAPAAKTD